MDNGLKEGSLQIGLRSIAGCYQSANINPIALHVSYITFVQIASILIIIFKNLAHCLRTL